MKRRSLKRRASAAPSPTISIIVQKTPNATCVSFFEFGWRSLLIGLIVLIVCLTGSQIVANTVSNVVVARVFEESLIIVGWVANWRPIEIYLYDWLPIRRRIVLFRRIFSAPVKIRSL